jgi:hypothetical protein
MTPDPLNQLLAGQAARLVHENFTGVEETWWWERRIGGGIAICQTLDPAKVASELSESSGIPTEVVREVVVGELGVEDFEEITLTFEVPGDISEEEAARTFGERSASPRGIAANVYREIEAALKKRDA